MERLWSPWRHGYVTSSSDAAGCVFCDAQREEEGRALILDEGPTCFVILNLYPYNSGHLMIVPHRHVGTLAALETPELTEMAQWTRRAEIALTEAYQPQGINVGMNLGRPAGAGVLDHLHVHLVPRWTGDTNFMPVLADVKVLPEHLLETRRKLAEIWPT